MSHTNKRTELSVNQFKEILERHDRWTCQKNGGKRAKLQHVVLPNNIDLRDANLANVTFLDVSLININLSGACLHHASLTDSNFCYSNLAGANLEQADLSNTNLNYVDLRGANLRSANLENADLTGACLDGADLTRANLYRAVLFGASIHKAKLRLATLKGAKLCGGLYQVIGFGSEKRCTTYDAINDCVICGCWDNVEGNNSLTAFKEHIERIYGEDGITPNNQFYKEYRAIINLFELVKGMK